MWRSNLALTAVAALFIGQCVLSSTGRADYILNHPHLPGTFRIANNGSLVGYYQPPEDVASEVEEYGEDYAVTPDLKTVYQFTNSLGFSFLIFAYDADSRECDPTGLLHGGIGSIGFPEVSIVNAQMPLIRSNDPYGEGDLFAISENLFHPNLAVPKIQRFNRDTDQWVESILPPAAQHIYDFAFGPDDRLYMAAEQGIFVYEESSITHRFGLLSTTPLIEDVTGTITFDSSGRLYVRNVISGNVDRYTSEGELIDTFISAASIPEDFGANGLTNLERLDYPGRGSIQFGVDGNLHVLIVDTAPNRIGKYDGTTGQMLGIVAFGESDDFLIARGRVTYLPIPEPTTLLMAIAAAVLVGCRRQ